mmetsp:Transcript_19834/g.56312  ORF Transcript_19834/g.56312 Transcript_19834/m.56312 type:complete len:90 (+) Transcript_19834:147-416(+)
MNILAGQGRRPIVTMRILKSKFVCLQQEMTTVQGTWTSWYHHPLTVLAMEIINSRFLQFGGNQQEMMQLCTVAWICEHTILILVVHRII